MLALMAAAQQYWHMARHDSTRLQCRGVLQCGCCRPTCPAMKK